MFVHCVYFWLAPEAGSDKAHEMIADCYELLSDIPSVRHIHSGSPAMTPREVVDNSYSFGLCVIFDDASGHDVYASHPLHVQFMDKHRALWQRVQVYDFQT